MTDDDLTLRRRFYAEELQATSNLTSAALVEALARVPREAFLRPGPWLVVGAGDLFAVPRPTADADPRHVNHNLSVAIDAGRQLFNGAPGLVALGIEALSISAGSRVLHIGCGLGYYSAIVAHCAGPTGRVLAFEVDEQLACEARANLAPFPTVEVRCGDASGAFDERFDAILCNAGITHPPAGWLDALAPGGRMVVPITASFAPGMPLGKGLMVSIAKGPTGDAFEAKLLTFVMIYSAVGIRDETLNARIGEALKRNPMPRLSRLRRDAHDPEPGCWLHCDSFCLAC